MQNSFRCAEGLINVFVGKIEFLLHDNEMPYTSAPSATPSRSAVKSKLQYTTRELVKPQREAGELLKVRRANPVGLCSIVHLEHQALAGWSWAEFKSDFL